MFNFDPNSKAVRHWALVSIFFCISLGMSSTGWAWDNHAQLTYLIARSAPPLQDIEVEAESLDHFLESEKVNLVALLAAEERWLGRHLDYYPQLPETLKFAGKSTGPSLRQEFLHALRVNTNLSYSLFVQPPAGASHEGRPAVSTEEVSLVKLDFANLPFQALTEGESVAVSEVFATASDEPDHGMDIELFSNNTGTLGAIYGLGEQPFGNDKVDYGTQAPFHMGFFHESFLIKLMAKFSQKSLVAYRIHLYQTLARFAFAYGHPYWGYRFAGWAVHYIQDLDVPYHASMAPGVPLAELAFIWSFGSTEKKAGLINLLTTKHAVFETFVRVASAKAVASSNTPDWAAALEDESDDDWQACLSLDYVKDVVAKRGYDRAGGLDRFIKSDFPASIVQNPNYIFGVSSPSFDPYEYLIQRPGVKADFEAKLTPFMLSVGQDTRALLRSVLP